MAGSAFIVSVVELDQKEHLHREWEVSPEWLRQALTGTEALPAKKPGTFSVDVLKQGGEYIIRGVVDLELSLPCARTLDPAEYRLNPAVFLVLRRGVEPTNSPEKLRRRRPKRNSDEDSEPLLSEEDAALDTFLGDEIELDAFVREQILLELPMFPLRSDLRSDDTPAMAPPSQSSDVATKPSQRDSDGQTIDPRLAPLQALAEKLKNQK